MHSVYLFRMHAQYSGAMPQVNEFCTNINLIFLDYHCFFVVTASKPYLKSIHSKYKVTSQKEKKETYFMELQPFEITGQYSCKNSRK